MRKRRLSAPQRRQLRALVHSTSDLRLYRRALAVLLLDEAQDAHAVARWLGVSRATVFGWQQRFFTQGHSRALLDRAGRGRRSQWSSALVRTLRQTLERPPMLRGYQATEWTVPLLCAHLHFVTDETVSPTSLRRQLHRMGYRYKRPRYVLVPDADRAKKNAASVAA